MRTPPRWRISSGPRSAVSRRRLRSRARTKSGRLRPFSASSPNLSRTQRCPRTSSIWQVEATRPRRGTRAQARRRALRRAHLDVVARVGVERDEREAVLDQLHWSVVVGPELRGRRHAVRHERDAPDERDHAAAALGCRASGRSRGRRGRASSPGSRSAVSSVKSAGREEVRGLRALVLARVRDVAEHLAAVLGRRGGRHVGAARPGAVREPGDLADARSRAARSNCSPSASPQRP